MSRFADVILPLPLRKYYTYRIPEDMETRLQAGSRVIVPFGRKKYYTAIVAFVHPYPPADYETKEILTLLDDTPVLRRPQLKFWEWIAEYYLCAIGDVYKAALPSGLKLESETVVSPNPDYIEDEDNRLKERERILLDGLSNYEKISVQDLEKETGLRNILPVIRSLLDKEAIYVSEKLKDGYRPRTENFVKLSFGRERKEELKEIFEKLSAAKKQLKLLMAYLDMSGFIRPGELKEVPRKALLKRAEVSPAVLSALQDKGIFVSYTREVSRFTFSDPVLGSYPLNEAQRQAFNAIITSFSEKDVTLLHGVTSSGKTEIYIHLIEEVVKKGRQVLYLVPEIALTTQLTSRLQRVFGNALAIYHSKFSDNERVEIWNNLLRDKGVKVILGVRSSVFLPFKDLGLVIVDEEHENTYKQQDPSPRYHARNAAIVLASMHGAKTLLGTATPSIETYYNARQGKYGLVELKIRYEEKDLPEIQVADTQELRRKKQMPGNFSPLLLKTASDALRQGEQVILFQNRRGFAPMVECKLCAWVPKCKNCDVSMTYHKRYHQLTCHYCGYTYELPRQCPACGHTSIEVRGFGTERIEEDVEQCFPEYKVARMDLDTTRTRKAYEQIIEDFEQKKTQILIGTQMVTKGLDFDNVSVVGILSADTMMNFPDFRAHERAFQLMAQVAGRSGRKGRKGTVILQTAQPDHPLIKQVLNHDYEGMYFTQIAEREQFSYPPFFRLVYIYLKHRDENLLDSLSRAYADRLRKLFGNRILGPDNPPVARIQTLYIRKIVLKIETRASMAKVREYLLLAQDEMLHDERFRSLILYYDVDPM
ncbi:replication restart helicase PriA [Coprobacter tertius]|uniref:Replication restart protein PriA n=1 Tax=Coprobacter tertius TaxID=2944915 RepID=A0ABT1MGH2_9BACT|nr:primosomal protein N' [Coprobacter tertius]MCP9610778.1 primosomal protein N' [Coprobacter tertius]